MIFAPDSGAIEATTAYGNMQNRPMTGDKLRKNQSHNDGFNVSFWLSAHVPVRTKTPGISTYNIYVPAYQVGSYAWVQGSPSPSEPMKHYPLFENNIFQKF